MEWNIDTVEGMKNAERWLEAKIAMLADGGTWLIPRTGSIYEIHKSTKTVVCLMGGDSSTERVFRQLGWTVKSDKHDNRNN